MSDLLELAKRCEAATGPSVTLSRAIAIACGMSELEADRRIERGLLPAYTASLDAALTLVPEGMEKELTDLYGVARVAVGLNVNGGPCHGEHVGGILCLALCAAALRARADLSS